MPLRIIVVFMRTIPFKHWALYIEHGDDDFELFELAGLSGDLHYNTRRCKDPEGTQSYIKTEELGTISSRDVGTIRQIAANSYIKKGDVNWHCQHWILQLLRELQRRKITSISKATMDYLSAEIDEYSDKED